MGNRCQWKELRKQIACSHSGDPRDICADGTRLPRSLELGRGEEQKAGISLPSGKQQRYSVFLEK